MRDLSKHVTLFVATRWYELGLELLETKHEAEFEANSKKVPIKCPMDTKFTTAVTLIDAFHYHFK